MTSILAWTVLSWLAIPAPVTSVPPPPNGTYEAEITQVVSDRAKAQMKTMVDQLERDPSQPAAVKRDIRNKLARLKVAIYTTPLSFDDTVRFYEEGKLQPLFLKGDRDLVSDMLENARAASLPLDPGLEKAWLGKKGRSARWTRADGGLEIAVEDHLIDPRDSKITPRTVVMITSIVD